MVKLVYKDRFFSEVEKVLQSAILKLWPNENKGLAAELETYLSGINIPPEFEFGQAAFPCFPLAKTLRMAPPKIASSLVKLIDLAEDSFISKVESKGGYINFHVKMALFSKPLLTAIGEGEFFNVALIDPIESKKIVVEFSQPNTHKMVHVGHLRNLVLGDAICHLLENLGHQVVRVTYPGDLGTHIAKVLWYLQKTGEQPGMANKATWLGFKYAEAEAYVRSHPEEKDQIQKEIGEVLTALQNKEGKVFKLYSESRKWSLDFLSELYEWMGVNFDEWFFESECDEASRKLVLDFFEEGRLNKSDGAIGYDLSDKDLGFALLLKSDGNGLYLTKDLELVRQKQTKIKPDQSIFVVDARQKLHFNQLFVMSEILGLSQGSSSYHLSYESVVEEETGKAISSRERTGLEITELKEKMLQKVITNYLYRYEDEWSSSDVTDTAETIVKGALKYGMLRIDPGSIIKFSQEKWLALEGDTGPYLQYVFARCCRLMSLAPDHWDSEINFDKLDTIFEAKLIFHLSRFHFSAYQSAVQYKPHILTSYLFELCKLFNRFYKECPVLKAEIDILRARVKLVEATSVVLKRGLFILGIPVAEKM